MDLDKTIRLADIVPESVVDGKGIRMTVFAQGCRRACKGCHNPETWDVHGGKEYPLSFVTALAEKNPLLDGLTFSGGEPFLQADAFATLGEWCHAKGLNVWCYSGYTLEALKEEAKGSEAFGRLLAQIDVLVDGAFIEEQKDLTLWFRGSRNQRVIDMKKTRECGEVRLLPLDR